MYPKTRPRRGSQITVYNHINTPFEIFINNLKANPIILQGCYLYKLLLLQNINYYIQGDLYTIETDDGKYQVSYGNFNDEGDMVIYRLDNFKATPKNLFPNTVIGGIA